MKYRFPIVKLLCLALMSQVAFFTTAQRIPVRLSTGEIQLDDGNSTRTIQRIRQESVFKGRYYFIAKFSQLPQVSSTETLKVHAKLADKTYYVSTNSLPGETFNKKYFIEKSAAVDPGLKLSRNLQKKNYQKIPQENGRLALALSIFPGIPLQEVITNLQQDGFIIEKPFGTRDILLVSASPIQVEKLAAYPFVSFVQPRANDKPLNEKARFMSGAFNLNAPLSSAGFNLKGKNVVVGVGDNGDPSFHPDLTDRIINRTPGIVNTHGALVTGIVAGAGLLQPDRRGMAPLANIVSQMFSGVWQYASEYFHDFGMVLTNNSYGAQEGDCDYNGVYDLYSQMLDDQAFSLPEILHVFAAGNSGDDLCNPLPLHYGTVLGSYQSAKNTISVGRTDYNQLASSSSSSGPVKDGRLKPEITALGIVESTDAGSGYVGEYGTSLSAPIITGGLALLYERYRQLNNGNNPKGALMKALLLNGARDIGTPGPDYRHGYGFINLNNSIRMLNSHLYFSGNLAQGQLRDSIITVPAGTALLKVMLYWHDPAASPLAASALVNDLDLEVIRPDGTTIVYPKILDPLNPLNPATEGKDHRNNSEQVVIATPVPGNYTIRVKATDVVATPNQDYYVAFDPLPAGIELRTPVTGETWSIFSPDEFAITGVIISWDDEGTGSGTYKLEYSLDNGGSWATIVDNLNDDNRYYGWRPADGTSSNTARIRITKNTGSFSATSGLFTILNRPSYTVTKSCEGYLTVTWTAVPGADDYEILMKQGAEMVSMAIIAPPSFTYTINGLSRDSVYYVAVRARKGGIGGRWIKANGVQPNGGACAGTLSDGDLKLDSITSPIYGRDFTSTSLGNNETVKVRIKNLDNAAVASGGYLVKLSVDGGAFSSQPGTGAIAAQGTYLHNFTGVDLSAKATHTLVAVVQNVSLTDNVSRNDTFRLSVNNLPNEAVSLVSPWVENFETAPGFTFQRNTYGLPGINRFDYQNFDPYGRIRSFVNTGIAKSGNKAITLDVSKAESYVKDPTNYLTGTFNLSNYTLSDDIRFDFQFKQHGSGQFSNPQNKIWIRGSDNQNWVEAYDLSANLPQQPGEWKLSKSIELNDILAGANPAQQFSSSTQIRIGQYAKYGTADNTNLAGLSFDDLRLYIAVNDLQLTSIDTPSIYACGLNNSVPVKITIRNSSAQAIANIPVSYTINGGSPVNEIVSTPIPANSSFSYQFTTPANLSANGIYSLAAFVNFAGDNVVENNSATAVIYNQPYISNFPYLEDFEAGSGNYFVSGLNTSWQWGIPKSVKIDTAASGIKAWKTRLVGNYNDRESSQLNSPCFNISALQNPMLSFSMAYDIEDCSAYGITCDAAWVEYSTDGITWQKLGANGQGTNWYDNKNVNAWVKRKQTHWHVASIPLPKGLSSLRIRFVFNSDDATNYEGVAIDDIHIYDLPAAIYTGSGNSNPVTQPVSANQPVHFYDGRKLLATILPGNNNLGNTEVKAYLFNGAVRNYSQQYYGNRNITVKPASSPVNPATVRFYFTDAEADSLRLASSCAACTNPRDYTHIGVTQYSDADKTKEDGDLTNNQDGIGKFIHGPALRMVPFDAGYYAEFTVTSFSEFWLNDGRGMNIPLPARWLNFEAIKQANSVVKLTWSTANESGVNFYEVEVARSSEAVNNNQFETIGQVPAKNANLADYSFLDTRAPKSGDYYYRVKQVDAVGKIFYSPVVPVHYSTMDFDVKLYPNPVKENLKVSIETTTSKKLQVVIFNMAGQQLYTQSWLATAGISQNILGFHHLGLAAGVYTVAIGDGQSWWFGKVVKE